MLSNQIVLDVNEDNDDGTTAEVEHIYDRFSVFDNRSEYVHENHTTAARNKLGFYRTFPKASGNFRGAEKVSFKFTEDISVPGVDASTTLIAPDIGEVSFSTPVGATVEQKKAKRMRLAALLADDDVCGPLLDQQQI